MDATPGRADRPRGPAPRACARRGRRSSVRPRGRTIGPRCGPARPVAEGRRRRGRLRDPLADSAASGAVQTCPSRLRVAPWRPDSASALPGLASPDLDAKTTPPEAPVARSAPRRRPPTGPTARRVYPVAALDRVRFESDTIGHAHGHPAYANLFADMSASHGGQVPIERDRGEIA